MKNLPYLMLNWGYNMGSPQQALSLNVSEISSLLLQNAAVFPVCLLTLFSSTILILSGLTVGIPVVCHLVYQEIELLLPCRFHITLIAFYARLIHNIDFLILRQFSPFLRTSINTNRSNSYCKHMVYFVL